MALGPGSIAFTGINTDGTDSLAFAVLEAIPSGTVIFFQDNEWNGSAIGAGGAFNTGESAWSWTATADIAPGTIVTIDNVGSGTIASNLGTVAFVDSSNRGLANSGEVIYAFIGSSGTAPTAFLTAVSNNTFAASGSIAGTGLTAGVNAVEFNNGNDVFAYAGGRGNQSTFSSYAAIINNPANWIFQDGSGDQSADSTAPDVPFSATAFTISAAAPALQSITPVAASKAEGSNGGVTSFDFIVSLDAPAVTDTLVSLALTGDTSDFASVPTSAMILTGNTSAIATFGVNADSDVEPNEDFTVSASLAGVNKQANATIANDDLPPGSVIGGIKIFDQAPSLQGAAATPSANNALALQRLDAFTPASGNAEVVAFDASTHKMFVLNAAASKIEIVQIGADGSLTSQTPINLTTLTQFGAANSVAVQNGIVAVAYANSNAALKGFVALFDFNGVLKKTIEVGVGPDEVTFTPDGHKILTADEAEAISTASNPSGTVSIIDVSEGAASASLINTISFAALNGSELLLKAKGVALLSGQDAAADIEPEYIAVSPDGTRAYVTLQEVNAVALVDLTNPAADRPIAILPLGGVDHGLTGNEFDPSDQPVGVSFKSSDVIGLLQPDAIASFKVGVTTYFITANEGDSRVGTGIADSVRLGSAGYVLDPTTYPNAAALKANAELGRLNVLTNVGDIDDDGDFDQIYTLGGRGFSIFKQNTDGSIDKVYESGGEFEHIIAQVAPTLFNQNQGAANGRDTRSDDKGPEPEGVTIGIVDGETYAFIALERVGGLMVYNVSDPANARFVRYMPPQANDQGPEVVTFVPSQDSPTGRPLVLSANEVSGTVTVYQIDAPKIASGAVDQESAILWGKATATGNATFEVATDAAFTNIVATVSQTVIDITLPVKVEIAGLASNKQYFYRFVDGDSATATGTFGTAASFADGKQGLSFGVSGDWRGELAPYSAVSNADEAGLKFFIELGDTIYADYPTAAVPAAQATTLAEYRAKHDEVYSDHNGLNTLGDLRASTPVFSMIDDHEVTNDFAGGAPAASDPVYGTAGGMVNESPLYNNGVQAFVEYNPIAAKTYSGTGDPTVDGRPDLYSTTTYGKDAQTFVVDERSFRSQELAPVTNLGSAAQVGAFLAQSFDPTRTMLGQPQLARLEQDLLSAQTNGVTWKFVMMPEPVQNLGVLAASDRYEGYAAERSQLLKFIEDHYITNVVFVSADIHGTIVNNLTYQTAPGGTQFSTGAFEITTGSVAFDAPFGQTVADLASTLGLIDAPTKAFYDSLPISPDASDAIDDKDDFIEGLVNQQLTSLGYDPVGLDHNLQQANGRINASLTTGDYLVGHTFGWTKFDIDPTTQGLTVTTYGVPAYDAAELAANPAAIADENPQILSQFTVQAQSAVTPIYDIQGSDQTSSLVGQVVTTRGVVIAKDTNGSRGYYIQDANGDGNAATSDGIFVFTNSSTLPIPVGHLVEVRGTVAEFTPSGAAAGSMPTTEIVATAAGSVVDLGVSPNAITPIVIGGPGGVLPPTEDLTAGSNFFESLESMLVTVKAPVATGPTNSFGEIETVVDNDANAANGTAATGQIARGNLLLSPGQTSFGNTDTVGGDFNPERIQIDDDNGILSGFVTPAVNVGAHLSDVTGIVNYDFGNYQVVPTQPYTVTEASPLVKETGTLTGDPNHLLIASYNAENLDPKVESAALVASPSASNIDDDSARFDTIASQIFNTLHAPDIIAMQEIQDNDGAEITAVTSASVTLQMLVDKINVLAAGSAHYSFIDNPFITANANGGQPGGNIRTAYLYRDDRVTFVSGSLKTIAADGSAISDPSGNSDQAINPDNPFFSSRPPLVATFNFNGQDITVVDNHFTSKGGSGALFGSTQPSFNGGEVQRAAQAQAVNTFVDGILASNPNAKIVVAGDLNEYPFEQPISVIKGEATLTNYNTPGTDPFQATATYTPGGAAILTDLQDTLPSSERYDYVFEGNSQTLDHILVSNNLANSQFDVVRINAEFADQTSDHDPLVARINMPAPFTLQILHLYGEAGTLANSTAPLLGAMVDQFKSIEANTLVVAEGDTWIPGPWLVGGADPSLSAVPGIGSTALGRPDIAIMNALGVNASALGNHEFDLGSSVVSGAIAASGAWQGAQFPLITGNLDFSADSSLKPLADASLGGNSANNFAGKEASAIKGKIAPYTVVTINGEKVGIVGATTYDLLTKTSPNGTQPKDDGNPSTSDLQEVAAYIQSSVNALTAAGINKIVMVDQLDTMERNKLLAPLVSGIDVMVAGGGHERQGDATDTAVGFNGHDANFIETYPVVTQGLDGNSTLIVTTDTEYTYLGRAVVTFDGNGHIDLGSLNIATNGAYAANEATLQSVYGSTQTAQQIVSNSVTGAKVQAITNAINNVVVAKDGAKFGFSDVYLEGDRVFGRTQEVNLGDLTADANAWKAKLALGAGADSFIVSIKNGGGLRASIGSIDEDGGKVANVGNANGNVSQLDVENALRFDNRMMVFDTTPQGLLNIFNFAANLATLGASGAQQGGFPQIGGLQFSFDPSAAAGSRIKSIGLIDDFGNVIVPVVKDGVVVPGAPSTINVVILNFTANGGDGWPVKSNGDNFRFLLDDGTLSAPVDKSLDFTAAAVVPANALGEQKAFEDYLRAVHGTLNDAYDQADTPASQDLRIENLAVRSDAVLPTGSIVGTDASQTHNGTSADNHIFGLGGNDTINGLGGNDLLSGGDGNDALNGGDGNDTLVGGPGNDALRGDAGSDKLFGGAGNDVLNGGTGADIMRGGAGNDTYTVDDAGDQVIEEASDGSDQGGIDSVSSSVSFTLGNYVENLTLTGEAAIDGTGNALSNNITGNAAANTLDGGEGNDTLSGLGGDDVLIGGSGKDSLKGGDGVDDLQGGEGDDILRGEAGNDKLAGGDGNDNLDGGTGADAMAGGMGDDTYTVDDAGDAVTEAANEGTDRVNTSITYLLGANLENLTLVGTAAIDGFGNELDNYLIGNAAANALNGGQGNDRLSGLAGDDTLTGGDGDDNLQGGDGGDTLLGGVGNDTVDGNAGSDLMIGGAGNDAYVVDDVDDLVIEGLDQGIDRVSASITHSLEANVENLTLTGIAAIDGVGNDLNNWIIGNAAANHLTGGGGNDVLSSLGGDDTLFGGDGNDSLKGGDGVDSLQGGAGDDNLDGGTGADAMAGGAGNDTYTVDNVADTVAEVANEGSDLVNASVSFTLTDAVENLTLTGGAAINGTGNDLNNVIAGNAAANVLSGAGGNDALAGLAGDDVLFGGDGNDSLVGGDGNDALVGGDGFDTMNGGNGNDLLVGGLGNDVLTGGAGNDHFRFEAGFGSDRITDFTASDLIDLSGFGYTSAQAVINSFIQVGSNVVLNLPTGDQLTLQNVQKANLLSTQFIVSTQTTGPSSSQSPYLISSDSHVTIQSLLTAGDVIGGYKMVGIPDGLGAFDNGNGTFTVLMNNELGNTSGAVRAHGAKGAFVSEWVIDKTTLQVLSGHDLMQHSWMYNAATLSYEDHSAALGNGVAFGRFCSADLAEPSAFYNAASGLGYNGGRLFLNGEESGVEGRPMAHIIGGADDGNSYELAWLGNMAYENLVANSHTGNKTVVAMMDDGTNGQVYFYSGNKSSTGNAMDMAGLTGGHLFGVKVDDLEFINNSNNAKNNNTPLGADDQSAFSMVDLGDVSGKSGLQIDNASEAAGVSSFLRPEDGAWDTINPNRFYFVTTNGINQPSQLWALDFNDAANPANGGTIKLLLNGSEGQQMFDNIAVDSHGKVTLLEDVGNQAHLGKVWQYDPATDSLTQLAVHDSSRFLNGGVNFLTQDEEASGVIDLTSFLGNAGENVFLIDTQAHFTTGVPADQVEGGQLQIIHQYLV